MASSPDVPSSPPRSAREGVRAALTRMGVGDFLGAIVAWRQVAPANPRDRSVFRSRPLFDRLLGSGSPTTSSAPRPPRPPNDAWAALWSGDLCRARQLVERQNDAVAADGVLGVLDVLERRPHEALPRLDRAIAHGDPAYRMSLAGHRIRALVHLRRFSEVHAAFEPVNHEESFGIRVLRALVQTQTADCPADTPQFSREHVSRHDFINGVFCRELPAVLGQQAVEDAYASRESMRILLEAFLDRLAGNLGSPPTIATVAADGSRSYAPLVLPPTERARAMDALNRLRCGDPSVAERAFDTLIAEAPESPTFVCHRGELRLWTGRYADAAIDFEAALARSPVGYFRWAEIGGLAAEMFQGRLEEAAHIADHPDMRLAPVKGGTMPVYRGELRRRLGDLPRAIEDLMSAIDAKPSRVGARMNLCLALRAAGRPADATPHAAEILRQASPLMVDVAEQMGLAWGRDPSLLVGNDTLERALLVMRGNRSSSVHTWFDGAGRMRVLQSRESLMASAARELGAIR